MRTHAPRSIHHIIDIDLKSERIMPTLKPAEGQTIEFPNEAQSNAIREVIQRNEPKSLRTYTPTLAVLAQSEGCYHYTPEGRKLADFASGVLVTNLGHLTDEWNFRRIGINLSIFLIDFNKIGLELKLARSDLILLTR